MISVLGDMSSEPFSTNEYFQKYGIKDFGSVNDSFSIQILENKAFENISIAQPDDIQLIAAAQLAILDSYHREVLGQAKGSFRAALSAAIIGSLFFVWGAGISLSSDTNSRALIPLISGSIVEVIAGVNFYLYGQATQQLSAFHRRLDRTQRFLLANSICEAIEGESQQVARSSLVKTVSEFVEKQDQS